jgi:hypothetical protein
MVVFFVCHRLRPDSTSLIGIQTDGDVSKLTIGTGTMPVYHIRGDFHNIAFAWDN